MLRRARVFVCEIGVVSSNVLIDKDAPNRNHHLARRSYAAAAAAAGFGALHYIYIFFVHVVRSAHLPPADNRRETTLYIWPGYKCRYLYNNSMARDRVFGLLAAVCVHVSCALWLTLCVSTTRGAVQFRPTLPRRISAGDSSHSQRARPFIRTRKRANTTPAHPNGTTCRR